MNSLRDLPSVNSVLESFSDLVPRFPHELVVGEVRAALSAAREDLLAGKPVRDPVAEARASLEALERPSLRRVINATGVILHTNLGRSPVASASCGYCNLEYDLDSGNRGKRDIHIAGLVEKLIGVPGIAVNNNAAAVFLALKELASQGEVIVSRGELIEIGDGFRIPDIMAASGVVLREVGTTNRTCIEDYRAAIGERTRLLMIVHPSNYRIEGFTHKASRRDLVALSVQSGIPLYEDLGSGCVADLNPYGIDEPRVRSSIADGVSLVSFSGDKLLGGPQAGILAGNSELVQRLRRNPLFRAFRLDKLILAALEDTLRNSLLERWDRIPAIRMIALREEEIRERAGRIAASLPNATIIAGRSVTGGGSTPEQTLPTALIAVRTRSAASAERQLRSRPVPVIARIEQDLLLVDLRTVDPEEDPEIMAALQALSR
jgi:L-seryl-tRNA(Ser) seleniumtransferase